MLPRMTTEQHRGETAKNAGISLYPWEIAQLRQFATDHAGGNVAAVIRRGLASIGLALDPVLTAKAPAGALVNLARRHAPADADAIADKLHPDEDQAAAVARWLSECRELLELGAPLSAIHLAGDHEISAATVPLAARRYIPRLPRARWVAASAAVYPEPTPRDAMANAAPAPKPAGRK